MTKQSNLETLPVSGRLVAYGVRALTSLPLGGKMAWHLTKWAIRKGFPDVRRISVSELWTWLELQRDPAPALLDARAEAEFAISHLPGAQLANTKGEALRILHGLPTGTPIVVYCAIGYRAARMALRLAREGYTDVLSLDGAIFEWANLGYPLYRGQEQVFKVHPYNKTWGKLLSGHMHAS